MSDDVELEDQEEVAAEPEALPEIKQIIGALLFSSQAPLTVKQMANVFRRAVDGEEEIAKNFAGVTVQHVREALAELTQEMNEAKLGFFVSEVSSGFRLQNDKRCGTWIRQLLEKGRVSRLSKPALETLAIVAYRQPCTRADVEAIRGVSVDGMVRNLLEMQLIKVVGRSELPGRPWLFGTTNLFMEHFGLKDLDDLPGIQELRRQAIPEPSEPKEQPDLMLDQAGNQDPEPAAEPDLEPEPDDEEAHAAAEEQ